MSDISQTKKNNQKGTITHSNSHFGSFNKAIPLKFATIQFQFTKLDVVSREEKATFRMKPVFEPAILVTFHVTSPCDDNQTYNIFGLQKRKKPSGTQGTVLA